MRVGIDSFHFWIERIVELVDIVEVAVASDQGCIFCCRLHLKIDGTNSFLAKLDEQDRRAAQDTL